MTTWRVRTADGYAGPQSHEMPLPEPDHTIEEAWSWHTITDAAAVADYLGGTVEQAANP